MNNQEISNKINDMATKASLLIKARKTDMTTAQLTVFRKIVKGEVLGVWEWRSIEALARKGYIKTFGNHRDIKITL